LGRLAAAVSFFIIQAVNDNNAHYLFLPWWGGRYPCASDGGTATAGHHPITTQESHQER
jgi:hypothetical protein